MTFLQDILHICVLVYVGQSPYKFIDCALVIKPENVAAIRGKNVTLHCASDSAMKNSIAWAAFNRGTAIRPILYSNKVLSTDVSSYIYVDDKDDGNCSLTITASEIAAKRYVCIDTVKGTEASAELIVLDGDVRCCLHQEGNSVNIICIVASTGNWAPLVECDQWDNDKKYHQLNGSKSVRADNNELVSSWMYRSENFSFDRPVNCSPIFLMTNKSQKTTAQNIPTGKSVIVDFKYKQPANTGSIWTAVAAGFCGAVLMLVILSLCLFSCAKLSDRKDCKWIWTCSFFLFGLIAASLLYRKHMEEIAERIGKLLSFVSLSLLSVISQSESDMKRNSLSELILDVNSLKSLDLIRYPAEDSIGNFTYAIVIGVINGTTVEIVKCHTQPMPTDNKENKSTCTCKENLSKFAQEASLYRINYDEKA